MIAEFMSIDEVATVLRVSRRFVTDVLRPVLPFFQVGRIWRIRRRDFERYVDEQLRRAGKDYLFNPAEVARYKAQRDAARNKAVAA